MVLNTPVVIEGEIHLVDMTSTIPNATVYVQLLDVSLADAPSKVIVEEVIDNVTIEVKSPGSVPFSVQTSELEEFAMYTLAVHVDVSGKGGITAGDYITMESFPVKPMDPPEHIHVYVHQVKS